MKATTLVKLGCWLLVCPLLCASAAYCPYVHTIYIKSVIPGTHTPFVSANDVIDRLAAILNYLTPIAVLGVIGFGLLWHRGSSSGWSAVVAGALSLGCTSALLAFGIHASRGDYFPLSDFVWWLKPVGKLFGV
jgi:hypothetical protein